jgi:nucleotide-binding universal stress UspA family protein
MSLVAGPNAIDYITHVTFTAEEAWVRVLITTDGSGHGGVVAEAVQRCSVELPTVASVRHAIGVAERLVGGLRCRHSDGCRRTPIGAVSDSERQLTELEFLAVQAEQHAAEVAVLSPLSWAAWQGRGDPAQRILGAAHPHDVDVIVVGACKRTWCRRSFPRSATREIIRGAAVPVLVVR